MVLLALALVQTASAINLHIHNTGIPTYGVDVRYTIEDLRQNATIAVYHFVIFPGDEELTVPLPGFIVSGDPLRISLGEQLTDAGFPVVPDGAITDKGEFEVWFNMSSFRK